MAEMMVDSLVLYFNQEMATVRIVYCRSKGAKMKVLYCGFNGFGQIVENDNKDVAPGHKHKDVCVPTLIFETLDSNVSVCLGWSRLAIVAGESFFEKS